MNILNFRTQWKITLYLFVKYSIIYSVNRGARRKRAESKLSVL